MNQTIPDNEEAYEALLKNASRPVFLYMHGNSGNRASSHRVELYQLFQRLDFHVICFDYRSKFKNYLFYIFCFLYYYKYIIYIYMYIYLIAGYGDSDNVDLSEIGVVHDSKFVLEWLIKIVNNSAPIFVWGHSLGTG